MTIPKTQRQLQKEQTRRQILETALQVFARQGFTAVRTADIAQAAHLAHGTVFAHFKTQDALLEAVIEEFGLRAARRLHELAADTHSLRTVLQAHLQGLQECEALYTRLIIENRLLPEKARHTFVLIQSAISFHISQAAEKEIKEGRLRTCPIHLLFNTWLGLIHHYLANSDLFAPTESVLARYGQELLDHYLSLLSIPPGHAVETTNHSTM